MKGRVLIILLLVFVPLFCPKAYSSQVLNRIVAVVNDEVITLKDLRERAALISTVPESPEKDLDDSLAREALEDLIQEKLAERKAKELGIVVTDAEIDEALKRVSQANLIKSEELAGNLLKSNMSMDDYRSYIRKQLLREKLISHAITSKVVISEESIKKYYDNNKSQFQAPESVSISAIFIKIDQNDPQKDISQAIQLVKRIRSGEKFEDIANEYSVGPGRENGGDLGTFKLEELHPTVRQAVMGLQEGEVSEPFVFGNFIEIIKINGKKGGTERSFEEVKDLIREYLYQQELGKRFKEFVEELKANSYVKVLYERVK